MQTSVLKHVHSIEPIMAATATTIITNKYCLYTEIPLQERSLGQLD